MIVAAVPLKRLAEAKSRLASRLPPAERSTLVLDLLERTVSALRESEMVPRIGLATPEPDMAERFGVEWLPDAGSLNASLRRAVAWAVQAGAGSLLIVPADLPLITAHNVRDLLTVHGADPSISLAATQDGGTGMLLLTPPGVIAPSFGPGSFERHRRLAARNDVPAHIVTAEDFSFDLDTAADLDLLKAAAPTDVH